MEYEKNNEELYIDLTVLPRRLLPILRRFWILVLAATLLGGGLMFWRAVRSYRPLYRSEAMFSVSIHYTGSTDLTGYSYYYDKVAAQVITETFPYLLQSETMNEMLRQELGGPVLASVSSGSIAETNLFSLTATAADPQAAYDTLRAAMDVLPRICRRVVGEVQLVVTREPVLPAAPYNSVNWKRDAVLGASIGFMFSMGLLLMLAIGRRTVLSVNDVKGMLNLSCLARVPDIRLKQRKHSTANTLLVTRQESDSGFSESFRLLVLRLRRSLKENEKIILFTSTVPTEGKSSLAVNTALTLAKRGKKVLIVDADLRGPSVKGILNMDNSSPGLGEYLAGGNELKFLRCPDTGLYVCSGDEPVSDPTPLLRRERLNDFFRAVRPMFDYIVVDTPPCAVMADAGILSACADKVVYVIREDFVNINHVFDGVQALGDTGADICGFVLNRASAGHGSGYGYGYGYGYGSGYGYGYRRKSGYGYAAKSAGADAEE